MKDLCKDSIKAVSGGAREEIVYHGEYLMEDLGDGVSRLSMSIVAEGRFFSIGEDVLEIVEDLI